jgi:hypothetical protein
MLTVRWPPSWREHERSGGCRQRRDRYPSAATITIEQITTFERRIATHEVVECLARKTVARSIGDRAGPVSRQLFVELVRDAVPQTSAARSGRASPKTIFQGSAYGPRSQSQFAIPAANASGGTP